MDKEKLLQSNVAAYLSEGKEEMTYPEGIKWTKQRKSVYQCLYRATEPLTANQIYLEVEKEADSSYAPSTIYRILATFEEQDLVEKDTWMGEDSVVYSLNRGGHTHYAVCLNCHKRIPLESCPFHHIHFGAGEEDFQMTGHKLEVYGYCKDCKSK